MSGILELQNIIVVSDMNLTLYASKCRGQKGKLEPLANFFKDLFTSNILLDIVAFPLFPSWINGRAREEGITKRINRFLVHSSLSMWINAMEGTTIFYESFYDKAIMIQWKGIEGKSSLPFKLNHH